MEQQKTITAQEALKNFKVTLGTLKNLKGP